MSQSEQSTINQFNLVTRITQLFHLLPTGPITDGLILQDMFLKQAEKLKSHKMKEG